MDSVQRHFVLIPLLCTGHIIPMFDMAKLLAKQGVTITVITTTANALKFDAVVARAVQSGLSIRLLRVAFPFMESGIPKGCENFADLPSFDLTVNFFLALDMLQHPIEKLLTELDPKPSCMICDKHIPWTDDTSKKLQIPRIIFDGMNCFSPLAMHCLHLSKIHKKLEDSETFLVPDFPDRIEVTKAQLPLLSNPTSSNIMQDWQKRVRETELGAYGVVVNSFEELEPSYVKKYKKLKRGKVWCVGPLSLCNEEWMDKAQRGNMASIDEQHCMNWLDSQKPGSVVYACLGSITRLTSAQLLELVLGLEESNKSFVCVIRAGEKAIEMEEWMAKNGFEARIKERGLLINGWAPQVLILSHPSIGAFLTHCGWNSTLEGISAGVPMITWPLFAEQFLNERLVVQVLNVGWSVGVVQADVMWGKEQKSRVTSIVTREDIKKAIQKVMEESKEGEERRKRAKELGQVAKQAVEEGGSSYLNMKMLIQDIDSYINKN